MTLEEALARSAELGAALDKVTRERDAAAREAVNARDARRAERRKMRLDVAAKTQRRIADLQKRAGSMPSTWLDGGVLALEALHRDLEAIPDEEG
jgi:DNA anti-recombination protein RmuC